MAGAERLVARALRAWVRLVDRRAGATLAAIAAVTVVALVVAALGLGVNADTQRLLDPDLPFQKRDRAFAAAFPTLTESLLVVLEADSAEVVRDAARDLAEQLRARPDLFTRVFAPGVGGFFEAHGLLYRSPDELELLGERLAQLQPVLAELIASPTLPTLTGVIELGLERAAPDPAAAGDLTRVLDQFGRATVAVYAEHPVSVSWESVLLAGSALDPTQRVVLIADPVLDFDRVLQAARPLEALRAAAAPLEARGVTVRVTGYPALNHEEMLGLFVDVGLAGVASFALVLAILWLALRSKRLVLGIATTLLVGLVWTACFASIIVGDLNLVSIAFAVLFIGLGVDFGIHLGMHYAAERRSGKENAPALDAAVDAVGPALVLCTGTTAIGFFAFVPTDYRGVAELGLISGSGMIVILFLTMTLLPAILRKVGADDPLPERDGNPARLGSFVERRARLVLGTAAVVGLAAAVFAPRVRFDSNVVEMRDPDTESVQTFRTLLSESATSPWYVDVVAPDLTAAAARAEKLRELEGVERAVTLLDYVPSDQEEKLEILGDTAYLLDVPAAGRRSPPRGPDEQVRALRGLAAALEVEWVDTSPAPIARSARLLRERLRDALAKLDGDPHPDATLAELETSLLGRLPERLEGLRAALATEPVELADLPAEIRGRMLAEDGRARVQVFPEEDLGDDRALSAFVETIRAVEPEATGLPVNVVEFGRATARSLREAVTWALLAITSLLLLLWRRPQDAVLVMVPLLLAGLFTVGAMVAAGLPFNFANVIVLPLLLGIGVDSGIHLVSRARRPVAQGLVDTVTARAVMWSALTTLVSFATLALSNHRGIASLGLLLVIGMSATLVAMLAVLPAALAVLGLPRSEAGEA